MDRAVDQWLLESFDEALEVLGASVREVILIYLMKKRSISREEIPRRIDDVLPCLEELLGYGAKVVEKIAVKTFAEKSAISLSVAEGMRLPELVRLVRRTKNQHGQMVERDHTRQHSLRVG